MKKEVKLMDKFKVFLGFEDTLPLQANASKSTQTKGQTMIKFPVSMNKPPSEIKILTPKKYSDALHVTNMLKEDLCMILNFENLDKMNTKRFMDFISGTIYSLSGHMAKLGDNLILITPARTQITEDFNQAGEPVSTNTNEQIVVNLINNN
jgi:FtsZ-interacting cell division protein YlmF